MSSGCSQYLLLPVLIVRSVVYLFGGNLSWPAARWLNCVFKPLCCCVLLCIVQPSTCRKTSATVTAPLDPSVTTVVSTTCVTGVWMRAGRVTTTPLSAQQREKVKDILMAMFQKVHFAKEPCTLLILYDAVLRLRETLTATNQLSRTCSAKFTATKWSQTWNKSRTQTALGLNNLWRRWTRLSTI